MNDEHTVHVNDYIDIRGLNPHTAAPPGTQFRRALFRVSLLLFVVGRVQEVLFALIANNYCAAMRGLIKSQPLPYIIV